MMDLQIEPYTFVQARSLLRAKSDTMAAWIADGTLPSRKLGRRCYIDATAVNTLLAQRIARGDIPQAPQIAEATQADANARARERIAAVADAETDGFCPIPAGLRAATALACLDAIRDVFGTGAADLAGASRANMVVEPRHYLMALLAHMGFTCAAVGRLVGRDHSTVLNGIGRAEALRARPEDDEGATPNADEHEEIWKDLKAEALGRINDPNAGRANGRIIPSVEEQQARLSASLHRLASGPQITDIVAYTSRLLDPPDPPHGPRPDRDQDCRAVNGLWLLAREPEIRERALRTFTGMVRDRNRGAGAPHYAAILPTQARRLGYPVVQPPIYAAARA